MDELHKDLQLLEYLYKEYVRLGDLCDSYAKSSFDDFKLLSAIGVLLVWKPIAELTTASSFIVLLGFLAILFIVAIIGTRDLLKQSLINYYLSQIQLYEEEIRRILAQPDTPIFNFATNWEYWHKQKHLPVAARLYLLIALTVTVLPSIILALQKPHWYAAIYALVALFALAIYLNATQILFRKSKRILPSSRGQN
ncbi:hypothetical protein H6F51_01645 [Cyanobacteria bacterium FACHB-DQ100]|nr:hypothetical protein [Cyanobacteria bacterium FACHB-DQ100]